MVAQSRASTTTSVAPDQVGRDTTFIEEDVVLHVAKGQPRAPAVPLSDNVGAPLFVGVYRFF